MPDPIHQTKLPAFLGAQWIIPLPEFKEYSSSSGDAAAAGHGTDAEKLQKVQEELAKHKPVVVAEVG